MKIVLISMLFFFLYGCEKEKPIIKDAGTFISSEMNTVTTSLGTFKTAGNISAFHGETVYISVYRNNYDRLCVRTIPSCKILH